MTEAERASALATTIEEKGLLVRGGYRLEGPDEAMIVRALRLVAGQEPTPADADLRETVALALANSERGPKAEFHFKSFDDELAWSVGADLYRRKADAAFAAISTSGRVIVPASGAARDVLAERRRQVEGEGYTAERDDGLNFGILSRAASGYAYRAGLDDSLRIPLKDRPPQSWPFHEAQWKPTSPRRDLVKAAALILAEIERIDRAALARKETQP